MIWPGVTWLHLDARLSGLTFRVETLDCLWTPESGVQSLNGASCKHRQFCRSTVAFKANSADHTVSSVASPVARPLSVRLCEFSSLKQVNRMMEYFALGDFGSIVSAFNFPSFFDGYCMVAHRDNGILLHLAVADPNCRLLSRMTLLKRLSSRALPVCCSARSSHCEVLDEKRNICPVKRRRPIEDRQKRQQVKLSPEAATLTFGYYLLATRSN